MKTYKNFYAAFAVILVVLTLIPQTVFAASFPKHENYVADEADILSEETISLIKDTNKTLSGDVQLTIAVCTVASTGDEDIAAYARDLFTEWKLGEGILLLIAKDDNNYFFVPSTGVEDILTNEEIAAIRDKYFEADFSNGIYERAVQKAVMRLKTTLVAGVEARAAAEAAASAEADEATDTDTEEKGTPAGNAIVGFFKFLLWVVIIAAVLFVGVFVWAMFNEDVAALLQKYIFRRKNSGRSNVPQHTYDDRLYGSRNMPQRPMQAQRRPNPNGYYNNGGGYPQQAGYLGDGRNHPQGYPQNGYPQQMQGQQNYNRGGYSQQNPYPQGQYQNPNMPRQQYPQQQMNPGYGYPQQNGGYPQQGQYQQNPYGQQNNGYYAQGQQGYPQQNQYGGQPMQQNYNNRQGYGGQQNNNDATVQFNIPRRS
ncbi:MAG: TPM domain-containing protein [Clostridia bacterium]|nr:TPM domain-containing protein [Clostridia bacterium]